MAHNNEHNRNAEKIDPITLPEFTKRLSVLGDTFSAGDAYYGRSKEACKEAIQNLGSELLDARLVIERKKLSNYDFRRQNLQLDEMRKQDELIKSVAAKKGNTLPKLFEFHHPLAYTLFLAHIDGVCATVEPKEWRERAAKQGSSMHAALASSKSIIERFGHSRIVGAARLRANPDYYKGKALELIEQTAPGEPPSVRTFAVESALVSSLAGIVGSLNIIESIRPDMTHRQFSQAKKLASRAYDCVVDQDDKLVPGFVVGILEKNKTLVDYLNQLQGSVIDSDSTQGRYLGYVNQLNSEINNLLNMTSDSVIESASEYQSSDESSQDIQPKQALKEAVKDIAKREEREREDQLIREKQEKLDKAVAEFDARRGLEATYQTISAKSFREFGLSDLEHVLYMGVTDKEDVLLREGQPKEKIRDLLSFLLHLQSIKSKGLDRSQEAIQMAKDKLLHFEELSHEEGVSSVEYRKALESPHPLLSKIESLREEWPTLRQIIATYWPDGNRLIKEIDTLLYPEELQEPKLLTEHEEPELIIEGVGDSVIDINERDMTAIAEQLDQVILPPNPSIQDIEEAIERMQSNHPTPGDINWDRLRNLAIVSEKYNGRLFRSKKESLGSAPAYFVVLFSTVNDHYAIAETPAKGNATYIVAESQTAGSCLEILELSKEDARALGAMRIIHRNEDGNPDHHLRKIEQSVAELETIQRAA